ncbi:hypothetical protein CDD83_2545 [Cordyceps sp. RAO-2017]|nr:hypothetical protein CDD83_2545 [Cordyceps sp. RAO-2017]
MALAAYRQILRAAHLVFQGDVRTLSAARDQIRTRFQNLASADPSSAEAKDGIKEAYMVAQFLRSNVVQGEKLAGKDEVYKLRIHKSTEKGDNESIKMAGSGGTLGGCGCK